jgi:hypothetical protein
MAIIHNEEREEFRSTVQLHDAEATKQTLLVRMTSFELLLESDRKKKRRVQKTLYILSHLRL